MQEYNAIQLFEDRQVRVIWDDEQEKYFFSVVDVVQVLTDTPNARKYWSVLKTRLKKEGSELATNCSQLKMPAADGKKYLTDVADTEQILRLIQSIPSKKAEPFKLWLAEVGRQRIDQLQDPELSIQQAIADYRRLGYSDNWINQRVKSIETRKELTDEWKRGGIQEGKEFAMLTDVITKAWSGKTTREYKRFKGLKKENLRDNMTNLELALNTLAEAATAEFSKQYNPKGMAANQRVAKQGGNAARVAREQEILAEERKVAEYQQSVFGNEGLMIKKRIELIQPIQRRVFTAIENYAKSGGYEMVLDTASNASMLYHSDSVDHTTKIIELLK